MIVARRIFALIALASMMMLSTAAASAQEIRYFVVQSTGLFEITDRSTGGRFTVAPTNERIQVPGRGVLQVRGTTDRAARREVVVTQIRGSGPAHVSVTFRPERGGVRNIFTGTLGLTAVVPQMVSADSNLDNVNVAVSQHGRTISRRLPIGSRP